MIVASRWTLCRLRPVPGQGRVWSRPEQAEAFLNLLDLERTAWEGPELEPETHYHASIFKFDGGGFGKGGTGVLIVDGKEVDKKSMENTTPIMFPEDGGSTSGRTPRTPVALISTLRLPIQVHGQDQ